MEQEHKQLVIGILAHVDSGKTTLSEALLYGTGTIRKLGRVDHKDAFLDTDALEKARGITIFSKQALFTAGNTDFTLLDTPGHVDFSTETERTLQVLDYAVLVISGTDGVQSHTETLWRLLRRYRIPTFVFVNKMDLPGPGREALLTQLNRRLGDGFVDFGAEQADRDEALALCDERLMETMLDRGSLTDTDLIPAIARRHVFPCWFGSALKLQGVDALVEGLDRYTRPAPALEAFGAKVFKVSQDEQGNRLTWLRVTGGALKVKAQLTGEADGEPWAEKANQLRLYSGAKFTLAECIGPGQVCAVTGLTKAHPGEGLGAERDSDLPVLEPVLSYQVLLPEGADVHAALGKLHRLEEEEPQLHVVWNETLGEIHVQLMGEIQLEVLKSLLAERYGLEVSFGPGGILYKETITEAIEGVGHYEPLRHYAEVQLLIEPLPRGAGIQLASNVPTDALDLNWQRLIATHIMEREHPGVLTGSALTDVKITILSGRAHIKHTEGGDFRQATYRAIRQGVKSTESVLLEPVYAFTLEVPQEMVGRAMTDLKQRAGKFDSPEFGTGNGMDYAVLQGTVPVATMQDYSSEVHAYTRGLGHLTLELSGYDVCHNSEEVIAETGYDSEADTANPTGSVFCAHGAGFIVPWDQVDDYMHLPRQFVPEEETQTPADGRSYETDGQSFGPVHRQQSSGKTGWELDQELQQIYAREFGMSREDMEDQERRKWLKKKSDAPKPNVVKYDKKGNPIYPAKGPQEEYLIVDGYNIIFAWKDLNELSRVNIDSARDKLLDILSNYQGYKSCPVLVVFDAYKRKEHPGARSKYHNLDVVYTKTDETADAFIERTVHEIGHKYRVTVATNDGLEQLTVMSQGALRMSADNLREEIERLSRLEYENYLASQKR